MRLLDYEDDEFETQLNELLDRENDLDGSVDTIVTDIIANIRLNGDQALQGYTAQLDSYSVDRIDQLELTQSRLDEARTRIAPELLKSIETAASRIRAYHEQEVNQSWQFQEDDGTVLGQKITALDRVGVYVPGGKAAYPSSVLMTVIPAKVAGVGEVIMTVPFPSGEVNDAVLVAASVAGVDRIFSVGGAQAVAAMAYGTETVPRVDKIVGPGNIFVATAKKMVFGQVGIDMIAGPSEVAIICDDSANSNWVAMDLFAQAEHDELAQSIVITPSNKMVSEIEQSINNLLPDMERKNIIESALSSQGAIIKVPSMDAAVDIANRIAPEHLELMTMNAEYLIEKIRHAGAIFVGHYSAESLGDYCAGTNHVLPTAGTARFSSPLGVYDYQKRSSIIMASKKGAHEMAETASILARAEGLTAHARSAEYRLESKSN